MINLDLVKAALAEDLAGGVDVTSTATISADAQLRAEFVTRESGVVAGIEMAQAVMNSKNKAVADLATSIINAQEMEIEKMKELLLNS